MNLTNSSGPTGLTHEQRCELPTKEKFLYQTAFLIFILILTFIGNLLVLLAVIFFRRLRTITNYFVVSLAVSDLLTAMLSLPFRIDQTIHNAKWCLSLEACKTWIFIDATCSYASICNLAIISIDRYFAIVHPFRYHAIITNKMGYCLIGCVWTGAFVLSLAGILVNWTEHNKPHIFIVNECQNNDKINFTVATTISFFLPLLIILFMYGAVFRVALSQARAMAALEVASANRRGRRSSVNLIREVKAAKTLAIVIGCFVVCWFPFTVIIYISLWAKSPFENLSVEVMQGLDVTFIYVLPAVNSTLNPIIYALFNRDFRQAFLKLIKRITGQRLGAVGFGEGPMTATIASVVDDEGNKNQTKGIRFKEHDSENSDALPNIPMRDPNSFYNGGCDDSSKEPDNSLTVTHDTKSMETTLDGDEGQKHFSEPEGTRIDYDRTKSHVCSDVENGEYSKKHLPQKLPPLERNVSQSRKEDDVNFGAANLSNSLTLPPIESKTDK